MRGAVDRLRKNTREQPLVAKLAVPGMIVGGIVIVLLLIWLVSRRRRRSSR